jgi:hypothetical protein
VEVVVAAVIAIPDPTKRPEEFDDNDWMMPLISKVYMLLITKHGKTPTRARQIIENALARGEFTGKRKEQFQQLLDDLARANPDTVRG